MLVLFCWGSITIILPDSGKFPQAEPVKWSQEELQHYLLLYKEIILNIESVVGSVTQLKIESVWRMEQDLKIMSDKVRQHQIQMPP